MNSTDRAIDCTPGKIITITLTCGSGSQVQTALRCDSDSSGNGNIHLLESDPCGVVQDYNIFEVLLLVFCVLVAVAAAAYPVFILFYKLIQWHKTVARREEELVEEEMREAEAARKWAGLTLERVPSHSDGEESDSESDFGCNTGGSESESSWTPSRCGIELKRSTISED